MTSPEEDQGLTGTQADTWIAGTATSSGSTISKVMVKIGIHGTYGGACTINAKPIDTLCYLQSNSTSFGSSAYFFKCFLSNPNTASTSFECGPGALYGSLSLPVDGSYALQVEALDAAGNKTFFPPGSTAGTFPTGGFPSGTPAQLDFEYGTAANGLTGQSLTMGSVLFGRAQWTQDDPVTCAPLVNTVGTGQQTVTADQVASAMYATTDNGFYGTPEVVTDRTTAAATNSCEFGDRYETWAQLQNEWILYGTYPSIETKDYPASYGALQTSQAGETTGADTTCQNDMKVGSVSYPCNGMYAYPNNRYICIGTDTCNSGSGSTGTAGQDYPVQCATPPSTCGTGSVEANFGFGRAYSEWVNWFAPGTSQHTFGGYMDNLASVVSVNGSTLPDDASTVACGANNSICYSSTGATVYTPVEQLKNMAADVAVNGTTHTGSAPMVQFYKFLVGSGSIDGGANTWNCTGSNPTTHYTFNSESYCYNDFVSFMDAAPNPNQPVQVWYGPAFLSSNGA